MPILAGIFSKKDKHNRQISPPKSKPSPSPASSFSAVDGPTIRVVGDTHKPPAPSPAPSPFNSAPSFPTDYVLPEISLLSAENGAFDDAISITASSSSAHPPSPSATQPVPPSSSILRLVNPFRKKSPSGDSQCESFHWLIPAPGTSSPPSRHAKHERHCSFMRDFTRTCQSF